MYSQMISSSCVISKRRPVSASQIRVVAVGQPLGAAHERAEEAEGGLAGVVSVVIPELLE